MKAILFVAALTLGGAAFAQTGNTVSDPSQSSGPRGVTQQGTDPEGQPCTPPGYNAGATGYPACEAGSGSAASSPTPPRCSKTVTDHCVQAYERGVRR
ncbi:MAG TPA: hypothetical protein VFZ91_03175 [Allosphingosinicella sp.]